MSKFQMISKVFNPVAVVFLFFLLTDSASGSVGDKKAEKPKKKKDLTDYNEADLERLYEQWEKDEEPLEPDELPEHLRPQVPLDLSKIDPKNPDSILQMSKKGKTLMMFVTVAGNPSKKDLEQTTQLWQTSLFNAHFDVQRFVIDENRAIFMFKDGSQAWEAKEFLLAQDRCEEVTIEGKSYPGKAAKNNSRKKDNIKQPKGKEDL